MISLTPVLPSAVRPRLVPGLALATAVALALLAHSWLAVYLHIPGAVTPPPVSGTGPPVPGPGPVMPPREIRLEPPETRPLLAIVIDDFGWGVPGTAEMFALPYRITMAVLPGGPFTKSEARQAHENGHEVFLHLPMEPRGPLPATPQFVTVNMTGEAIQALVRSYLLEVPEATGVNNHMGSRATADRRVARAVLEVVAEHGLIFVDSRTWPQSVMAEVAAELGIPAAVNQVFLDNIREADAITQRLWEGAALAERHGRALVIGHVHPVMAQVLAEEIPRLEAAGIAVVPASRVVNWDVDPPRPRLP